MIRHPLLQFIGPMVVALVFLAMLMISWRRWPDVMIDFGRELYVPWRITEGDVLYRDLAVFFGPLSSYVNALWFVMFGTSLMTLAMANAAILAVFTALLYWMLRTIAGFWSATIGCVAFLVVFAFGHLQGLGNYNFICPYSHELTHGTVLGLSCVAMLARYFRTARALDVAASGFLLGLTFLTKLEPFVATAASVAGGWLIVRAFHRDLRASRLRGLTIMFCTAFIPPVLACAMLASAMPFDQAVRGTLGSWMYVGDSALRGLPFYRVVMGTNKIGLNLSLMAKWSGLVLLFMAPALMASWFVRWPRARLALGGVAAVLGAAALWWTRDNFAWEQVARPLPLIVLAALASSIAVVYRVRNDAARFHSAILRVMFIVFAGGMLLKMILNARFGHYGFALAAPASVVAIAALMDWLPAWFDVRGRTGWILRGASMGAIAVWLLAMQHYCIWSGVPAIPLGQDRDWFYADQPRAEVVTSVLENLRKFMKPGSTMTVLPEGVMLNYLARRPAGTPYFNFLPAELAMFGEPTMLAALQAAPPDYIAIVHRDSPEYGTRFFGRDFGISIDRWIAQNYSRIGLAGDVPSLEGSRFGILVMQRKADAVK
jgi:hypothetical protein